jgi:hypothetical protein
MRFTQKYSLLVPSDDNDTDDVPTHVGGLADQLDGLITSFTDGPSSSRPAPGILNRYYFVSSGTGRGLLYRDTGTAWDLANAIAGSTSDVSTAGYADTPSIGTPSKGWAPADHVHGSQSNPVIAHVAASNPHPQYADVDTGWLFQRIVNYNGVTAPAINPVRPILTAATGFIVQIAMIRRINNVVSFGFQVKNTAAITVSTASGNVPDTVLATLATEWRPADAPWVQGLNSSASVQLMSGYLNSAGSATLTNTIPGVSTIAAQSIISLGGTYFL